MFNCWIWMFILLCGSSIADEKSIRDADIFPSSPEIERGSTLKLFCVLGKHYTPQRNASHIIWKLNHELIAQENYNIVNETVSSVIIHNFTYNKAHVKCFIKYLGKEQLLVHTEVKSGFPPDTPGNISCIYYFNVELTCNWTSGRETNLTTTYTLYRKIKNTQGLILPDSELSSCRSKTESCSFRHPNIPFSTSFCFQVKAQNVLGEAISECVPITLESIEKFEPPEILSVRKIAGIKQLLTVTWKIPEDILPAQYLNCQVRYRNLYSNSSEIDNVAVTSEEKVVSLNLTGLWDSTEYSVAVRCIGVESKFWSEWCREKTASTEDKAPSGKVDLWRIIESSHPAGNRPVHLMWKLLGNIPHPGRILGYKIQYFPENNAVLQMTKITTNKKIVLPLKEEAYIISVTAYNSAGNSPAAVLRIPSTDEKPPEIIETVRTFTTNEEMIVEWITSEPEVTEYVVEWYEELETDPFSRSWQYISNSTKWKANKKIFKPFVCYNMSVYPLYGNKVAAPYSIQTYVQEKEPSEGPVADTDVLGKNEVVIKWEEISKDKRNGFITNYTIFYKPEGGKELNETVNSDVLHHRLKSLQANTQYTVYIMASNRAGGTSGEQKTFKTLKFNKEDIIFIAIPVGLSMFFLLGLWITCILKKHICPLPDFKLLSWSMGTLQDPKDSCDDLLRFKKVCWPDIPNPAESVAVEWPLDASMVIESIDSNHHIWIFPPFSTKKSLVQQIIRFGNPENNSFLKGVTYEDKTLGLEDLNVLEDCFPEEDHEGLLLMNCENHVSECTDTNATAVQNISEHKITLLNGEKKIQYNEEHEVAKCLSPSMPYVITGEDFRSQMHSALIPAKKIQPIEMLEDDLRETQQISDKKEESDNEEVLKLEDFSEKTLFNPYLRNSVKTREFLISENLPEHSKNEPKKQPTVLPAFQQNAVGQSYVTLDMVGLATAH